MTARVSLRSLLTALLALVMLAASIAVSPSPARAASGDVTIRVHERVNGDPSDPLISDFRFIVNVDIAHRPEDGRPPSQEGPESFSPVVAKGDQDSATVELVRGRYLVSVIGGAGAPAPGAYKLSGKHFTVDGGAQTVDVYLVPEPLPTSSITVRVFHDNSMVNGALDIPQEQGLEGFSILLEDGTGEVSVDFYGNPLCTEYVNDDPAQGIVPGTGGLCLTDANGEVTIKHLAAHKYGVFAIPPDGSGWIQTSTLEGTHVIDAWIEEGNSGLMTEAGVAGPLVWLGYVQQCTFGRCPQLDNQGRVAFPATPTVSPGNATIIGRAVEASEAGGVLGAGTGRLIDRPYVALNNLSGNDEQVYTGRGNADGTFSIPNVPPGTYQLVVWDEPQVYIISFRTVVVTQNGGTVDVGDVLIPPWFGHVEGFAYWDTGKTPSGVTITGVDVAGPDATVPGYANGYRDCMGSDPFDYANCEEGIAGQDFVVHFNDGSVKYGGVSDANGFYSFDEHFPYGHYLIWEVGFGRNKQMHTTGYFTEFDAAGNVVPVGYPYSPQNRTTDPGGASLLQAEITLAGYTQWIDTGKLPYDPEVAFENGGISGVVRYAVTRNEFDPRIAAAEDYEPGVPGVTINLYEAVLGTDGSPVACDTTGTPSEGCPYGNGELQRGALVDSVPTDSYYEGRPTDCTYPDLTDPTGAGTVSDPACREVPLNVAQIQDGVFDGGYAFDPLPDGHYIVEMIAPPNYRHLKEEDQNTDQGDDFIPPTPAVEPADCAGPLHLVNDPRNPADGTMTPLCDSKHVEVNPATNPAADFFLMVDFDDSVDANGDPVAGFAGTTEVPPPGLMRGVLFDDLTVEFDPTSVMFSGKKGVGNTPVGILDFEGNEITVVNTDRDGFFEVLLPSTYTRLCPTPGGVCAGMYLVVGNYPGQDPQHPLDNWNPNYQILTMTLDVWTGKTTYADVAILPRTGFGFATGPVCTAVGPEIGSVSDVVVARAGAHGFTISGTGFGSTAGTVSLGGVSLPLTSWATDASGNGTIVVTDIPDTVAVGPQQLLVTDAAGAVSETGITIHVTGSGYQPNVLEVPGRYPTIQAALDAAAVPGNTALPDVVVVAPGVYHESPIVAKRVKLQGHGPAVTSIDGRFLGFGAGAAFDLDAWTAKMASYGVAGVPVGQVVTVVAPSQGTYTVGGNPAGRAPKYAQIDGFTVIGGDSAKAGDAGGASQGGGIYAHSAVHNLQVSNNVVQSNAGNAGGGIVLGQPYVGDNDNDDVRIHHNRILNNGGTILAGGIGIFDGADGYRIDHNVICGNHSAEYGGGISHYGNSTGGVITRNRIVFNSAFDEGGAIMIAGELPADPGSTSAGSGRVTISRNLIEHNLSNDDGGGIRLLMTSRGNGGNQPDLVRIEGNVIVDNLATDLGGGIALDDAVDTWIVANTIARNVSTATAEDADTTTCGPIPALATCPHGAGITSTPYGAALAAQVGPGFSDPVLFDNVIWDNRAWYRDGTEGLTPLAEEGVWDLEVVGSNDVMNPHSSLLTDVTSNGGYAADNVLAGTGPGVFADPVALAFRALPLIEAPAFVGVEILATPADPQGDYHLAAASPAIDAGVSARDGVNAPTVDIDGETRPQGAGYDIGADEVGVVQ